MRHATSLLYHVHAVVLLNKWFNSCETNGKLTLWTPLVFQSVETCGSVVTYESVTVSFVRSLVLDGVGLSALARKARGPGSSSSPGYNFSLSILQLSNSLDLTTKFSCINLSKIVDYIVYIII